MTADEAAAAARQAARDREAREKVESTVRTILDEAKTPAEVASLARVDVRYRHVLPEHHGLNAFGPPRGLDFRECWLRLTGSPEMPATHRLMHVTVDLVRRRFANYTRVRVVAVEDSGVPLWEASDPRVFNRGSHLAPKPFFSFERLPLHDSSATDAFHNHVFLTQDGREAYGGTSLAQGFFTDPYRDDEKQPFRGPGQHIWYACPVGERFAPTSGSYNPVRAWPRDALRIDVSHTHRVVGFESVPERQLQLMYWYSLQLSASG